MGCLRAAVQLGTYASTTDGGALGLAKQSGGNEDA